MKLESKLKEDLMIYFFKMLTRDSTGRNESTNISKIGCLQHLSVFFEQASYLQCSIFFPDSRSEKMLVLTGAEGDVRVHRGDSQR